MARKDEQPVKDWTVFLRRFLLPYEQIEEIVIGQIAGFAYFIVDGKISQFCRHFEVYCR